jgi:VCBS repeat-containing protein
VNGPGAVDVFTYTVRDSDGDESTTTITIDVANSKLYATSDTDVTVYEKALDLTKDGADLAPGTVTGSDPTSTGETASGTWSVRSPVRSAPSAMLVGSATGNYGQIVLNPNGTYTYTLTSPATTTPHADDGANTLTETFTYQATDSLGNVVTSTIVVSIVDDVPKAVNDSNATSASETQLTLTGNVLTNDVQGADVVAIGRMPGRSLPVPPGLTARWCSMPTALTPTRLTRRRRFQGAARRWKRHRDIHLRSPMPTAIPAPPTWC